MTPEASPGVYARVAGAAYLVISVVAVLYGGLVESKLIVSGDDATTANNILAHESLFRIGIVLVLTIYASVVAASWALYVILRTVHKNLALLALPLRSRYIPQPLAAWGIFTYVSMLGLALVSILFPDHPLMLANVLYGVGALFELVLGLWLLFKGVDFQQWDKHA